jgi:hypothetical protein
MGTIFGTTILHHNLSIMMLQRQQIHQPGYDVRIYKTHCCFQGVEQGNYKHYEHKYRNDILLHNRLFRARISSHDI